MKFLCVCETGQNRSVAITRILHNAGHTALCIGWRTADPEAFGMLAAWADRIIVVDDSFKQNVPIGYADKVIAFHVGEDRWPSPIHPDLHNILNNHYVAWEAGDKDPGRAVFLREHMFTELKQTPSDINEHLDTLREYASLSRGVLELGTRSGVSTAALLAGQPDAILTADINACDLAQLQPVVGKTAFKAIQSDSRALHLSENAQHPLDLLFVDTDHTFDQVLSELTAHASRVQKWIISHDTISFPPVLDAVKVFLTRHATTWNVRSHATNNNGLLVIQRIAPEPIVIA